MRRLITALLALAIAVCIFLPSARYTEDEDSVLLARTIYALGKNESYETKLKLGSVVMNRLENDWFPDDLGAVLTDPQQFPAGSRYDAESLKAAHAVLAGTRALDAAALYYQPLDAAERRDSGDLVKTVGGYAFYSSDGRI